MRASLSSFPAATGIATIFAYGQTGSGKTHTMMGGDSPDGIIPRLNSQLFGEVQVGADQRGVFSQPCSSRIRHSSALVQGIVLVPDMEALLYL